MAMPKPELTALVTGDIVLDFHLYGRVKMEATPHWEPGTVETRHPGGAALSHRILTEAQRIAWAGDIAAWEEEQARRERDAAQPQPGDLPPERPLPAYAAHLGLAVDQDNLRSYGVWTPHPLRKADKADQPKVWRVQTHFGYGSRAGSSPPGVYSPAEDPPATPSVILIDDGGILFRHEAAKAVWPDPSQAANPSLIVLKMSAPVCRGDLWLHLLEEAAERLLVIVSAEDLRQEDAQIRRDLSWEQTATDALRALNEHPILKDLLRAAQVVVNFSSAGALWLHRNPQGARHTADLIYDPLRLEGEYDRDFEGSAYGFQSCLAVSVAHQYMRGIAGRSRNAGTDSLPIASGIVAGLKARRKLLELGHGIVGQGDPAFPVLEVGAVIAGDVSDFVRVPMPEPPAPHEPCQWSIVADSEQLDDSGSPLIGLGLLTATYGKGALSHMPTLAKASLFTADRSEIESLRTLERLIREYEQVKPQKKPLSIGVFGPPGAGKSFGVKALAKAILGDKLPFLEFNLSQFKDPGELIGAFHRVRDEVLKGATPLAFWDEFDSQGYKWLQYLLAPMQDGAFQEGQITHPIGKCIFIFAGGTADRLEEFGVPEPDPILPAARAELQGNQRSDRLEAERAYREFKLLKGPDFVSRLHGYLNVLGPNPRQDTESVRCADRTWPIRRALMLRSQLGLGEAERLNMDNGLLRALLEVSKYTHGARSLEKILLTIKQGCHGSHFHRSSLPPDSLLERETSVDEFQRIMNQHNDFKTSPDIERLAAAIHRDYLDTAKRERWEVKPEVNKPYEQLAPDYQTSNRAAAQRIPDLLLLISYKVVPNPATDDTSWEQPLRADIARHRERLAQAEHLGWMAERMASGWTYAGERNDARKHHNLLVDWVRLSGADKDKDHKKMDSIPTWLELAGYKAVLVNRS